MNRTVLTFFIVLCLSSFSGLAFEIQPVRAVIGTVYIRADGTVEGTTSIQTADNVTYVFLADINDSIVVERDNIIIDGDGYTIQGSESGNGVYWSGISNVTVKNTNIKGFFYGISVGLNSFDNSISGNNITDNGFGISLYSSSNTSISGNTFTDDGLAIFYSYQNFVEGNTVNGKPLVYLESISDHSVSDAGQVILVNCDSIRVEGLNLSKASHGVQLLSTTNSIIARNNIANNEYGIRLDSSSNNSVSGNSIANNGVGIDLGPSSNNNRISGNNITANNEYGIRLSSSLNNSVSGNSIANNRFGIDLGLSSNNNSISGNNITANNVSGITVWYSSNNNSIIGNNITNNEYGISIYSSSDNNVYRNNFVENTLQVHSAGSINFWDEGYPSGGNYWSDYNGTDANRDGIGDTPYVIDENNRDNHPLMTPYFPSEYLQFLYMRFLYYDLLGKYNELLKSIVGLDSTFNELSSNYSSLLASFNGLNASYQQHLLNFSTLEANYTKLREDFDSLNTDYVSLNSRYQALNSSYNSLNASFNEYQASTQSELAYAKNLEYALTAITVILLVAIVYVVLRKPQTKSETQRPLQSTEEK